MAPTQWQGCDTLPFRHTVLTPHPLLSITLLLTLLTFPILVLRQILVAIKYWISDTIWSPRSHQCPPHTPSVIRTLENGLTVQCPSPLSISNTTSNTFHLPCRSQRAHKVQGEKEVLIWVSCLDLEELWCWHQWWLVDCFFDDSHSWEGMLGARRKGDRKCFVLILIVYDW